MKIRALPEWPFGQFLPWRLGVAFYRFGPTLGCRLSGRLALPPSNQYPVTVTMTNWVELRNHLTRANLAQATTGLIEGFKRGRCAPRSHIESAPMPDGLRELIKTTKEES